MYYNYFGLTEAPFSIAPNPEYLYMTERHQEALAHLLHGVESDGGFVLLTGDVGTGKTTVCRSFLSKTPKNTQLALILNPFLSARELLQMICQELSIKDVPDNASLRQLTNHIYEHLLINHACAVQTVLLIDEAQHLNFKVLELIRLLTNLETDTQKLLKIILVGQPELNDTINKPELTQLSQRVTARYHIKPLSLGETSSYIDYRLRMAGYMSEKKLFPPAIIKQIFTVTRGVPRLINVICDRALLGAYSQNRAEVDKSTLDKAITEVRGEHPIKTHEKPTVFIALAASMAVLFMGGYFLATLLQGDDNQPELILSAQQTSHADAQSPQQGLSALYPDQTIGEVDRSWRPSYANATDYVPPAPNLQVIPPIPSIADYYDTIEQAVVDLVSLVKKDLPVLPISCASLPQFGWQCRRAVVADWEIFKRYNRPAVISLQQDDGSSYYLAVTGVGEGTVQVLSPTGLRLIPLATLKQQWQGEFLYFWQPPKGFVDHIYFNSDKKLIGWLASAFSIIDDREQPLAKDRFNSLLKQRIILFQRENQLTEDGIAGVETILKINEKMGLAVTLNRQITDRQSRDVSFN